MSRLSAALLAAIGASAVAMAAPAAAKQEERVVCRMDVPTGTMLETGTYCGWESEVRRGEDPDGVNAYREEQLPLGDAEGLAAIELGSAPWEKLPELRARNSYLPYSLLVAEVHDILRKGECELPGQRPKDFDITVPYAILVEPDGTGRRVLVSPTDCEPIDVLAGAAAMARVSRGDILPTGGAEARWYKDSINFTLL